ncbi:MAG TPA: hypothetical protein VMU13_03505 [Candidatus Paceibacterota bacterium]|nr:hypothetical protein [Candidatus Paceibacterota bacterium]
MDWGRIVAFLRVFGAECIDALLPPHAHTTRTKARRFGDIPKVVAVHELLGTTITTLMDYRRTEVRDLIRSLKYDGNERAAKLCAMVLADFLREELAVLRSFSPRPVFIVPLPLHPIRMRDRGFNQITRVLEQLPPELRTGELATVSESLLVRIRDTPHQTSLARTARIANMKHAFAAPEPRALRHTHIFVIDDVTTTGATLVNAGHTLERHDAEVTLIALARA